MFEGAELNGNTVFELPKAGCDEVAVAAEVNGNMELDEALEDDPNTGALLLVVEDADAPNENTVEGDVELNAETNTGVLGLCQLEPKTLVVVPLLELIELASEDEAEELNPNDGTEPNGAATEVEEPNIELLEEKEGFVAKPNDEDDAIEPN